MANLWQFFGLPTLREQPPFSPTSTGAHTRGRTRLAECKPVEETTESTELATLLQSKPPQPPSDTPWMRTGLRLRPMENRFTTLAWWLSALPSIRTKA